MELWKQMKVALGLCLDIEQSINCCVKQQFTIALQKTGISMKFEKIIHKCICCHLKSFPLT